MEYIVEGKKFGLSYKELKWKHHDICQLSDEEFMKNLVDAAHLACMICFLKGTPTEACLSDTGIVHELIHLMTPGQTTTPLKEIREKFKKELELS